VQTGALGLSPPATFIRIPWTPRLADRSWLIELTLQTAGLIKPQKVGWVETLVRGTHYRVAVGFHEVRDRPLFPMYLAHRDRVVRLADAPAELIVQFPQSDRLKIDEVYPPTSIRRLSETLESTEVVSLFLDRSDGITPQQLAVQFGYFSRAQTAMLVAAPILLFALGQAVGNWSDEFSEVLAGMLIFGFGVAGLALTEAQMLRPRFTGRLVFGVLCAAGPYEAGFTENGMFFELMVFAVGGALIALGVVRASFTLLAVGVIASFVGLVTFIFEHFEDRLGAPVALMISGGALIAGVLLLARLRSAEQLRRLR